MSISTAEDFGGPANGDPVPRCAICRCPATKGNRLIPGRWGFIRWNMDLTLCERELVRYGNRDPRDSDPLTLEETG